MPKQYIKSIEQIPITNKLIQQETTITINKLHASYNAYKITVKHSHIAKTLTLKQ